jgi:hypothetical protein
MKGEGANTFQGVVRPSRSDPRVPPLPFVTIVLQTKAGTFVLKRPRGKSRHALATAFSPRSHGPLGTAVPARRMDGRVVWPWSDPKAPPSPIVAIVRETKAGTFVPKRPRGWRCHAIALPFSPRSLGPLGTAVRARRMDGRVVWPWPAPCEPTSPFVAIVLQTKAGTFVLKRPRGWRCHAFALPFSPRSHGRRGQRFVPVDCPISFVRSAAPYPFPASLQSSSVQT